MKMFTEGRWEYDRCHSSVIDKNGTVICKVGDDWGDYKNADKNVALILSAPEMYKEIEQDIEFLKKMMMKFVIGSTEFRACTLKIESKKKLLLTGRGESDAA